MSRCVRKLEGDDFYIIYCNTVDIVFPHLFTDIDTAKRYVFELENNTKLSRMLVNLRGDVIDMEVIRETEDALKRYVDIVKNPTNKIKEMRKK